jgi:multimeric flavodoxin WrbA
MKPHPVVLFFAAACLAALDGHAAPWKAAAQDPYAWMPSAEISTFIDGNLVKLLAPLPDASVIEKASAAKRGGGKPKKGKKKAGNGGGEGGNVTDAVQGGAAGLMVPLAVRTQATTLDTKLNTQAGTAPPDQKAAYQQALGISKLFAAILDARDQQITAILGILQHQDDQTDVAATGLIETGKAAAADQSSTKQKIVAQDNNDINDIETQWLKTAAGYQQQVDFQMDQLRAREREALMGPAAPGPGPQQ